MRTNLRENEKIIMTTQRHPVAVFAFYFLALAVLVLWVWSGGGRAALAFRYTFGYGFILVAVLSVLKTLAWQRDIWVVTNQRVVDEQGVFTIRSRECPLDKINNVMVAQSVLGRLLGYGNIQIQTAGEAGITEEARVTKPRDFRTAVFEQQEQYRERMMRMRARMAAEKDSGEADMRECPFCAEWIKAKAKICRFCDRQVPPVS